MPTIVRIEYPQLPIAAVKGKYYYHGMLVKFNRNEGKKLVQEIKNSYKLF